jgi:predicted DNA-binding protein (MmcQ/YjbR family)
MMPTAWQAFAQDTKPSPGHQLLTPRTFDLAHGASLSCLRRFAMAPKSFQQERLDKLIEICRALPETSREQKNAHVAFLVRKKIFAYYLNNHHGDNIVSVCCKVLPGENQSLVQSGPERFYLPAYIGSRGWIALRMDRPTLNWNEVKELIQGSYLQSAPKRLAALLQS